MSHVRGPLSALRREDAPAADTPSPRYKYHVLGILTLVYTLNFLDRGLIILLLQPIKEDLSLSDTQLGFLTGIAFGLFYATLGVPIARATDRGNRVNITSVAIALWGVTVMVCLLVTNFVQLVCARIAAAVGEAGCMPPTYSLIGDYFPQAAERTRAMTLYFLAGPIASLVSFGLGGWLNELYGWRWTFFIMGLPALLTAIVVKAVVREPRMQRARPAAGQHPAQPSFTTVLATLWGRRSSRHLSIATILLFSMGLGLSPWYAAFLMRSHHLGTAELGVWMGLIFGLGGLGGILAGGYVASRWFSQDERGQLRFSAVVVAMLVPCFVAFLLVPGKHQALIALVPLAMALSFFFGPSFALMQRLVPDEMRATTLATVMLLANLIGMGLGPQIVGILSDLLMPMLGMDSLRYAMLSVSFIAVWAAWHFWQAGQTVREDLMLAM